MNKIFWKILDCIFIVAGLTTWINTLLDMLNGFVILPSRYEGNTIISSSAPSFFWGVAIMWFVVGMVFFMGGVWGLRNDIKGKP